MTVAVLLVRQSDIGKPPPPDKPGHRRPALREPERRSRAGVLLRRPRRGDARPARARARAHRHGALVSFSFKGKELDAKTIAERLGVTTVLEGSVRRDGQRLKLNATLIDGARVARSGPGASTANSPTSSPCRPSSPRRSSRPIVPASRGEITEGRYAPTQRLAGSRLVSPGASRAGDSDCKHRRDAVNYLEKAIQADPNYAKAYAALTRALLLWTVLPV